MQYHQAHITFHVARKQTPYIYIGIHLIGPYSIFDFSYDRTLNSEHREQELITDAYTKFRFV